MSRRVLPGFKTSLGFTIAYLALLLLVPMAACLYKASSLSGEQFVNAVWTARTRAAYQFTLEVSVYSATASFEYAPSIPSGTKNWPSQPCLTYKLE